MVQVTEKMQTVLISGPLAKIVGKRKHTITTSNGFRDVVGYFKQFPGYEQFMMESEDKGLRFAIFNGKVNLSEDDLEKPTGNEVIRIVPIITGSKRAGSLQTIIGAALIVVGLIITGGSFGTAAPFGSSLIMMGASMMMGGVIQMLSPLAKGLGAQDRPENRPSYSFNGPVNTSAQGNPVGLLYGQMIVGSSVISAGIYAQDQL